MGTIHADVGGKSKIRYPASATASAAAAATTTDHQIWSDAGRSAPRLTPSRRLRRPATALHHRLAAASSRRRRCRLREGAPSGRRSSRWPASRPGSCIIRGQGAGDGDPGQQQCGSTWWDHWPPSQRDRCRCRNNRRWSSAETKRNSAEV